MASWLEKITVALNGLPAHETVRDIEWIVPAVQTIHILAVGLVFSASMLMVLRTLGVAGTHWSIMRWHRRLGPWTAFALVLLLLTGAVMILAEPERELLNGLFQIKMPLVLVATVLSFWLGGSFKPSDANRPAALGAKLGVIIILLMWAAAMCLGRWIAYAG